jgi:hypothetical protein
VLGLVVMLWFVALGVSLSLYVGVVVVQGVTRRVRTARQAHAAPTHPPVAGRPSAHAA